MIIFKQNFWAMALALMFVSCNKDSDTFSQGLLVGEEMKEEVSKGSISLNLFTKNPIEISSKTDFDLEHLLEYNQYYIVIVNNTSGSPEVEVYDLYSNLPEEIELSVGSYDIDIAGVTIFGNARFDGPIFTSSVTPFEIVDGEKTVVDFVLTSQDVATTVNLDESLFELYENFNAKVTFREKDSENKELIWLNSNSGKTGYFTPDQVDSELNESLLVIEISGKDGNGEVLSISKTYEDVQRNSHYILNVRYSGGGSVELDITTEEEDQIEDTINFPFNDETSDVLEPGDLIITEVMFNPDAVADADGEWFEVYNTTNRAISLRGLRFLGNSAEFIVEDDVRVLANSYFVFGANKDETQNGGIPVDYGYSDFPFSNTSLTVGIYEDLLEIDVFRTSNQDFPEPGKALNRSTSTYGNPDSGIEAWCYSVNQLPSGDFGSPGETNNECD